MVKAKKPRRTSNKNLPQSQDKAKQQCFDDVRHDLKILLNGINTISDWIQNKFGVQLIDKESQSLKAIHEDQDVPLPNESSPVSPVQIQNQRSRRVSKRFQSVQVNLSYIDVDEIHTVPVPVTEEIEIKIENEDQKYLQIESDVDNENDEQPEINKSGHSSGEEFIGENLSDQKFKESKALPKKRVRNRKGKSAASVAKVKSAKTFICVGTNCAKAFLTRLLLARHVSTIHAPANSKTTVHVPEPIPDDPDQIYKCGWANCGKLFMTRQRLNKHTLIHTKTKTKTFQCDYCAMMFLNNYKLTMHRRTHTGEKPYSCRFCDKKFARKSTMRNHVLVHTGDKPFLCHYCERSFSREDHLKAHLTIHTGEKPYKCDVCGKKYRRNDSFYYHKKGHYKPVEVTECNTEKEDVTQNSTQKEAQTNSVEVEAPVEPSNDTNAPASEASSQEPCLRGADLCELRPEMFQQQMFNLNF